ncbi:MAG: BspA family leucine-rich repeat surface protein [Lachnospiraceae bacterium]|nr:BspA family leucine-rich repeat surface protein [Lachnospiraceae bacterium]
MKKCIHRIMFLMLIIVILLMSRKVEAATIKHSGTSGSLEWSIDSDGVFRLSGSGDYELDGVMQTDWYPYADEIKKAVINVKNIISSKCLFAECFNLTYVDVSGLDTSQVTDMSQMFYKCYGLREVDISKFDTSQVTDMREMFWGCSSLTELDASKFDTSQVTDMAGMFYDCWRLNQLDISRFDTSQVTDMRRMFYGCSDLAELDVGKFDTSQVTNMAGMFYNCWRLNQLNISKFDTLQVTNMYGMFEECSGLKSLDVGKFDTSQVTDMAKMFWGCSGLKSLDVGKFDTSQVTDMYGMFYECSSLTELDVSKFDTSQVTDMAGMFEECSSLTELDVSKFDTSQVTDMSRMFQMFYRCSELKSLDVSKFDTSQVTSMAGMFCKCSNLVRLDVSKFDTSQVTDMADMFYECSSLTGLDVSEFDTSKVTDMGHMFDGCSGLTQLDVSKFNTLKVTDMYEMFNRCSGLIKLNLSNFDAAKVMEMDYILCGCSSLVQIKSPYNSKMKIYLPSSDNSAWKDSNGNEYEFIPAGITKSITLTRNGMDETGDEGDDTENAKSVLKSVIYKYGSKKKDVLTTAHTVETSHAPFTIECSADTKEKVTYYIDTENGVLRSTDGIFKVDPADLEVGKNVSIIVKESDGKAYRTTTLLKVEDPNALKQSTIKLGAETSFQLGENVPFVGGSTATFNIPAVPVSLVVEDGMVKAGFNIKKELFSYNSAEGVTTTTKKKSFKQQWDDIKWDMQKTGYINKDYKGYLQQCDLEGGLPGMEKKVTFSIAGYAEGTWSSDSQMETIGGEIVLCISGKGVARKQVVWIVPISLRVEATASGSVTANVSYDFVNSQLKGDLSLLGSISLEPFVGIGVSDYLSVGAYGKGTANIYATLVSSTKPLGLDKFTIQGQAGIKGYLAKKELINIKLVDSKERTVYERTSGRSRTTSSYALETSANSALNNNLEDESTSWVEYNDSDVNVKPVFQAAEDSTAKTLVKNIYGACTPQVAQIDDIKVYGYVDETGTRENVDQTVAKYVVYDEKTGTSSQEAVIDDDGTADYKLQFVSNGEHLYAVYLDADCIFGNTEPDINTYAKSFKVTVARFDQAERKFIKVGTYNKNDCYCYNPTLAITDDGFQLSWCENNDNEVMALTDTNQLYCVSCEKDGTIIQNIDSIGQDLKAVTSLVVDPQGNILYFEDKDNLLTTPEQRISYYEANTKQLKNITNCASESNNVSRLSYQNKPESDQENILCLCDGIVSYFDSKNESIKYCDESAYVGNTATYYVRDNAIFYADNAIHKLSYNGKSYIPCDVTEEEGEITSFATDGTSFLYSVGTADYKTPKDKEFKTSCDLKYISGIDKKQVTLKDISYDYNDFTRGEDALVKISLTNSGLENLDGVKVVVTDKDSNVVYSEEILQTFVAGDTTDIEISLEDVESLASGDMNISVTGLREEAGVLKEETEKSSEVVNLNKAELSVEGDVRVDENDDTYIHVDAINSGTKATTAVITLKNGEESLFEKEVEIAADSTEGIDINDLDIPKQEQLYTVNIKTQDPEFYTSDNEVQIAVMKLNVPTVNEVDAEKYDRVDDSSSGKEEPIPDKPAPDQTTSAPDQATLTPSQVTQTLVVNGENATTELNKNFGKVNGLKIVAKKSGKIKITWKKITKESYYQVQISTKKNFKKGNKLRIVRKTKFTWKRLKKGKTYYVRVRACANGQYGAWSKAKKVKVK